jgi:hypothetical protein
LMQNSVLETLLVVDYMTECGFEILKISWESWAPKSKFAGKSGTFDHIFLNNSEVPNIFLGQVYLFRKLRM